MKKKIINIIGGILVVVSIAFIVSQFPKMTVYWVDLLNPSILSLLVTMPFLSVISIFLDSFCWKRSLALFTDHTIYCGDTFAAYTQANLAKYLPGNIGHYVARQMFGAQIGLTQLHLALSSMFEIGYNSLSMLALSLLFSASTVVTLLRERFDDNSIIWFGAAITAGAILLSVAGFIFRKNKYATEIISLIVTPRFWLTMLGSFVLNVASMIIISIMFVVIVSQYVLVDFQGAFLLIGGSITSHFVGFIIPGVPGGIGVREAMVLLLLTPFFPSETILLAAVVQRIITVIGDIIVLPISHLFKINTIVRH